MDEIENQNFSLFFNGTEYLCDFKTIMNHSKSVFDSYNRNGNRTFSLQYEGSPTFFDTISELYSGGEIDVVKSNYDFVKSIASQLQDPSLEKLVEQFETVSSEYENLFSTSTDFEDLKKLENLIYSLSDDNFEESIKLFLGTLLYTNNSHIYTLTQSIFGACISKPYNIDLYIKFISSIIRNKDESNKLETLVYIFIGLLATYNNSRKYFNEIIYILYSMYQNELISPEMQYKTPKIRKLLTNFFQNINEIENKINNERLTFIISAIEKDDENNLQSIISNGNIDINSSLQRPYYIPSNLINNNETLIQICAFFGSYNCFNFLLQNNVEIDEDIIKYAIFGGNEQIINSLIEQNFSFEDDLKLIIKYHRNELFFQIYQPNQRCLKQFEKIARKCITYGNFSLFEFIMKEGLNVNGFYNDGKLLYKAIKLQNMQIVSLLCKISYIDLNIIIDEGNAFLHIAVEKNNIDLVKILLKCKNLNINMYNKEGLVPLHIACKNGDIDIVKFLMKNPDFDVNIESSEGLQPIHFACTNDSYELVKLILDNPSLHVNLPSDRPNPLHYASKVGNLEIIKFLLSKLNISINSKPNGRMSSLLIAAQNGNLDVVKYFCSIKQIKIDDKSSNGMNILHYACENGNPELVSFILSLDKIDVNELTHSGLAPIHIACENDNFEAQSVLLSYPHTNVIIKASEKFNNMNALHFACKSGSFHCTKLLLDINIFDINEETSLQETPFLLACTKNNVELVKLLLEQPNINIMKVNDDNYNALHIACQFANFDVVELLLNLNVFDVYAKTCHGVRLMHFKIYLTYAAIKKF